MNKYYFAIAIVASLLVFSACTKDESGNLTEEKKVDMTFGISLPNQSTRTVINKLDLSDSKQSVFWVDGDKVSVFAENHSKGDVFTFSRFTEDPHNVGVFSGKTYELKTGGYYGLYPAQEDASLSYDKEGKGMLTFTIKHNQTAKQNSFDPEAAVMIGKADTWDESKALDLNNACASFVLNIPHEGCESVVIEAQSDAGESDWYIAGKVTAEVTSSSRAIKKFDKGESKIVLTGGDLGKGGYFVVPFVPSTKCPKIIVTANYYPNTNNYYASQKVYVPNTSGENAGKFQFTSGNMYNLGTFEYVAPTN